MRPNKNWVDKIHHWFFINVIKILEFPTHVCTCSTMGMPSIQELHCLKKAADQYSLWIAAKVLCGLTFIIIWNESTRCLKFSMGQQHQFLPTTDATLPIEHCRHFPFDLIHCFFSAYNSAHIIQVIFKHISK